jgi:hypothetical protein
MRRRSARRKHASVCSACIFTISPFIVPSSVMESLTVTAAAAPGSHGTACARRKMRAFASIALSASRSRYATAAKRRVLQRLDACKRRCADARAASAGGRQTAKYMRHTFCGNHGSRKRTLRGPFARCAALGASSHCCYDPKCSFVGVCSERVRPHACRIAEGASPARKRSGNSNGRPWRDV